MLKDSKQLLRTLAIAALVFTATGLGSADQANTTAATPVSVDPQQVISYLNQTIDWYRHLAIEEQLATDPTDVLFVNDDRQVATQVLRLSFDYGRAAAQIVGSSKGGAQTGAGQNSRFQSLLQMQAKTEAIIRDTQDEIDQDQAKLQRARGKQRQQLQSTVDELQAELGLAQARQDTLRNMLQFVGTGSASSGNLGAEISQLQQTVPEAAPASTTTNNTASDGSAKPSSTASTSPAPAAAHVRREQPSGILALVTDLFSLTGKIHTIDDTLRITDSLAQSSKDLRDPLVRDLNSAVQRGDVVAQAADTADQATLQQQKKELDALTARFRQESSLLLPLGKQSLLFDLYKSSLTRWKNETKTQYQAELKNLGLRLIVLAVIVGAFLLLSEAWKRATFRYVQDYRRRYQFLLLRRILVWCVIGITIAFALATEVGSLATFAGLITAGIAVALQNVILAVAGYFFLIGRYGVRVGDRVQISGVTGDVIDIGLVRIHLMEMGGSGNYIQPTGRVVVFSNSIVFQPTASFYKQIPGTNFVWHEVTLTLAPDSDIAMAESRLLSAVRKVYETYKAKIELEHRAMQQSLNIRTDVPKPVSRLRLTSSGLEVVIRYPVELDSAADVDDRITRELIETLAEAPQLQLVGSGTPNIQAVPNHEAEPQPVAAR